MLQLSVEDQIQLCTVRIHPTSAELEQLDALIPQVTDWDGFVERIIAHGSASLFFKKLPLLSNSTLIPSRSKTNLQQAYYKTLIRSMLLYQAFTDVVQALDRVGVKPVVLKGAHLAELLYGDIALRQFSDLDILVQEQDGEKSLEALKTMGFKPREMHALSDFVASHSDFVHYPPMEKAEVSVEVHIKLHDRSRPYQLSIPDILSRATDVQINKQAVKVLCLEDLLMHLCIHADKHFTCGHIQLKSFTDIVNLLDQLKTGFDWEHFESLCKSYKCEQEVFKHFVLLARYFRAYLPEHLVQKYAYCLTPETEKLFVAYLHGESFLPDGSQSAVPGHIDSLRNMKSLVLFFIYLKEILFPGKAFMLEKYGLVGSKELVVCSEEKKEEVGSQESGVGSEGAGTTGYKRQSINYKLTFWWLWYPYRWAMGVKGLIEVGSRRGVRRASK